MTHLDNANLRNLHARAASRDADPGTMASVCRRSFADRNTRPCDLFRRDCPALRVSFPEFPHDACPDSSPRRRRKAGMYGAATDCASPTWGRIGGICAAFRRMRHRPGSCRAALFRHSSLRVVIARFPWVAAEERPRETRFRNQVGMRPPGASLILQWRLLETFVRHRQPLPCRKLARTVFSPFRFPSIAGRRGK